MQDIESHTPKTSGPEVIKLFLSSTQLSTKFILLINVKMSTIVGILTAQGYKTFSMLDSAEHEIYPAHKWQNANNCWHFIIY